MLSKIYLERIEYLLIRARRTDESRTPFLSPLWQVCTLSHQFYIINLYCTLDTELFLLDFDVDHDNFGHILFILFSAFSSLVCLGDA
jgi:hypothetical protein